MQKRRRSCKARAFLQEPALCSAEAGYILFFLSIPREMRSCRSSICVQRAARCSAVKMPPCGCAGSAPCARAPSFGCSGGLLSVSVCPPMNDVSAEIRLNIPNFSILPFHLAQNFAPDPPRFAAFAEKRAKGRRFVKFSSYFNFFCLHCRLFWCIIKQYRI